MFSVSQTVLHVGRGVCVTHARPAAFSGLHLLKLDWKLIFLSVKQQTYFEACPLKGQQFIDDMQASLFAIGEQPCGYTRSVCQAKRPIPYHIFPSGWAGHLPFTTFIFDTKHHNTQC